MESIRELYRIGHGPSSSHTMGPKKAAEKFLEKNSSAHRFEVILYGSLAATGLGHLTDLAIKETFKNYQFNIQWEPTKFLKRHPNALKFKAYKTDELYSTNGQLTVLVAEQLLMMKQNLKQ